MESILWITEMGERLPNVLVSCMLRTCAYVYVYMLTLVAYLPCLVRKHCLFCFLDDFFTSLIIYWVLNYALA